MYIPTGWGGEFFDVAMHIDIIIIEYYLHGKLHEFWTTSFLVPIILQLFFYGSPDAVYLPQKSVFSETGS